MAAYFNLTPIGAQSEESLVSIDEKICKHFGVKCDKKLWYGNWYNTIGFALAVGKSFDEIKELLPENADIVDFISANYTKKSWFTR